MNTFRTVNPLFASIAAALGCTIVPVKGHDVSTDRDSATFVTPEGHQFYAVTGGYAHKGKVHISICFPQHVVDESGAMRNTGQSNFQSYNAPYFDGINVSATKTGEQIAKDIQRRFMPTAIELWKACEVWCKAQADYYGNKAVFKDEVVKLLEPHSYGGASTIKTELRYVGKDYASIVLDSLNIEQVRKLAAFLATL